MANSPPVCKYTAPDDQACGRPMVGTGDLGNYCVFHRHHEQMVIARTQLQVNFMKELQIEIDSKNGNWRGFSFPPEFRLPNVIDFQINAKFSRFNNLKLEQTTFQEECNFSDSRFLGETLFKNCNFNKNTELVKSIYEDKVEFLNAHFECVTSFYESEFLGRALFRVNFSESVNFNNSIFKDAVIFQGWRSYTLNASSGVIALSGLHATISQSNQNFKQKVLQRIKQIRQVFLQKIKTLIEAIVKSIKKINTSLASGVDKIKRRFSTKREGVDDFLVFEKEGQFSNVIFYKPDQLVFNNVNMSKVYLAGTNFRGSRFLGVNWYQPKLKRNGLHEELFIRGSGDANFMQKQFPQLEESYRNIRATLEDNLNYQAAADFYVGEMDAQCSQLNIFQRHFFSVVAWYKAVSNYGTSVFTALRILLWVILLHWALSMYLNFNYELHDFQYVLRLFQRSLTQFTIQNIYESSYYVAEAFSQKWADIGLKLLGISQLAMLIFAFRSRIKRH